MDNIHYIYVYLDPRKKGDFKYDFPYEILSSFEFEPFYIGKGKGDRCFKGIRNNKNNLFKKRKISKIKKEGLDPIILILKKGLTNQEACNYEQIVINKIGRYQLKKGPLTNLTDGGEGTTGHTLSIEKRKLISDKIKEFWKNPEHREKHKNINVGNKYRLGRKHTDETKKIISQKGKGRKDSEETKLRKSLSFKGRVFSKEHLQKISMALKGKKLSESHIASLRRSHIGIKSKNSIKVRNIETGEIFESIKEASNKYKVDPNNIGKCCKKMRESVGGFHWEYASVPVLYEKKIFT